MTLWDFPLATSYKPCLLTVRSGTQYVLVVVCVGIFVDVFVYGVVVPILPFSLEERAGVTGAVAQRWVLTLLAAFGASFMISSILCGFLCGRLRARRVPLLLGVLSLLGGTTIVFFTSSLPVMVLGRLLQGAGSADTWILGQALVTETVGKDSVGRVVGYLVSAFSLSSFVAPVLGGVIYQEAGYMTVYGMLTGLICINISLIYFLVERHEVSRWPNQALHNQARASLSRLEVTSTRLPVIDSAPQHTLLEIYKQLRTTGKLSAFVTHMLSALLGVSIAFAGLTAFETTVPQFVSETFDWNARAAGLVFLAPQVPLVIGGPIIGPLVDKYSARWIATAGLASSIPWWVLLGQVNHNSLTQKIQFCTYLALLGLSVVLATTALMAAVAKVDQHAYILSFAFSSFAIGNGVTVGSIWSGLVQAQGHWATMAWSFAVAHGIAAIVVMLFVDGWLGLRWLRSRQTGKTSPDLIPSTPTSPTPLLA